MSRSVISSLVASVESGQMSRRELFARAARLGIGASVASLALETGSATLDARRAAAAQASADGYVTIGNEANNSFIANFNPTGPAGGSVRAGSRLHFYECLGVWNSSTNTISPSLGTAYGFSEDNLTFTVKLAEGVKWSDGEPFTSKDVIFTWDMYKKFDGLGGNGCRTVLPYLKGWSAPDDYTVQWEFSELFTLGYYNILGEIVVPEHIWKDIEDPVTYMDEKPVGTGPFTTIDKFENQIYQVGVNPEYRFKDKLKIKGARYTALADNSALGLALTNGELDWAGIFLPDIENSFVAKDPEHNKYWFPPLGSVVMFWPNTTRKPFDDVRVRKAMSMAFDRQQMSDVAMWGYSVPADATGLSRVFDGEKTEESLAATWTTQNLEEAAKLLDEAGLPLKDGKRQFEGKDWAFDLTVVGNFSDYVQVCEIAQSQLAELGITVNIDPLEWGAWADKTETGKFDTTVLWSSSAQTVYTLYRATMSSATAESSTGRNTENYSRWSSPDADALLEEYAQTSDPDRLLEISAELQAIYVENAPCIPLFYGPAWGEFTTLRYDGYPSEENPYTYPSPDGNAGKQILVSLYPVGTEAPDWSKEIFTPMEVMTAVGTPGATPEATPVS